MDEPTNVDIAVGGTSDIETAIDHCLAEIRRAQEGMVTDQAEIDSLKAETRALLSQLRAA